MKHLKTYEGVWSKNIKNGNIYVIPDMILAEEEYRTNILLGKVIKIHKIDETIISVDIKTFIKKIHKEYVFKYFPTTAIKRLATPEEIDEFEAIETSKKYKL